MQGFAITILSACVALGAVWYLIQKAHSPRRGKAVQAGLLADGYIFLFSGRSLWIATEAAEGLLASAKSGRTGWERLLALLPEHDGIADLLAAFVERGIAFREDVLFPDGRVWEVEGRPRGSLAALYLRDRTEERRQRDALQHEVETLRNRLRDRDQLWQHAPLLAWRTGPADDIVWSNAAFQTKTRITDDAFDLGGVSEAKTALTTAAATARISAKPVRVMIEERRGGQNRTEWMDVETRVDEAGFATSYARDVTDLVHAEDSLRRFISTLTETFAHLPIGLAIFDDKRRLSLFNPALTDLVQADPARLAQKPSLREFLDRLREKRIMPEQRDYEQWRANVARLEAAATAGTLSEHWFLSSGQTLHVTGRPHPNDAIAILFEDISAATQLERRFSSEIELSRATLDLMQEAVAVYDTAGELIFSNKAFAKLWDIDMATEGAATVADVTKLCCQSCQPSPVWGDLREFATGREQRAQWDARFRMLDGREIHGLFAPMPGGSTLTIFNDISSEERTRQAFETRLAQQRAADRVAIIARNWALVNLKNTLDQVVSDFGESGTAIARAGLAETIELTDEIVAAGSDRGHAEGPLKTDLETMMAPKALSLDLTLPNGMALEALSSEVYRVLLGLVTIANDLAETDSVLSIDVETAPLNVDARFPASVESSDRVTASLPYRLLARTLADQGGGLTVDLHDGALLLRATGPAAEGEALAISRTGAA